MFISSLNKVRINNVNFIILNVRTGPIYFISKSKEAVG